jgi:hypothetical protein
MNFILHDCFSGHSGWMMPKLFFGFGQIPIRCTISTGSPCGRREKQPKLIAKMQDDGLNGTGYNWALEEKPSSGLIGYAGNLEN